MEALEGAVKRLKMLAEVSSMADVAASTLSDPFSQKNNQGQEESKTKYSGRLQSSDDMTMHRSGT